MNRSALPIGAIALLAACGQSPIKKAQAEYDLIRSSGTLGELCSKGEQIRDLYLSAQDRANYETWSAIARVDCRSARQEGANMPANGEQPAAVDMNDTVTN